MTNIKKFAAVAAVATLTLTATDLSASAQSALTNGPDRASIKPPGHTLIRRKAIRTEGNGARASSYAYRRPLTVRRTVAVGEAPVVVTPAPVTGAGPGTLVTAPLGFASNVVSLPFRAFGGVFPASGDLATNPLVLIGAPLHAVGDIVQIPFRVIGAPFGGTTIATY